MNDLIGITPDHPDRSEAIIDRVEQELGNKGVATLGVQYASGWVLEAKGMANGRKTELPIPPQHIPEEEIEPRVQEIVTQVCQAISMARDPVED